MLSVGWVPRRGGELSYSRVGLRRHIPVGPRRHAEAPRADGFGDGWRLRCCAAVPHRIKTMDTQRSKRATLAVAFTAIALEALVLAACDRPTTEQAKRDAVDASRKVQAALEKTGE